MAFAENTSALPGATEEPRRGDAAPVSTIPYRDGFLGLGGLCLAWLLVMVMRPSALAGAWIVLLATALPMLAAELRRAPAPTQRRRQGFAPVAWIAGLVIATVPFFIFNVQAGSPLNWSIAWLVAAPAFAVRFAVEWRRNGAISGGFPVLLGKALWQRDRKAFAALAAPGRVWALKAIFIPLYGLSLFALIHLAMEADLSQPLGWLVLVVLFFYTIDLGFGLSGYVFASDDLVPTMRSTQHLVIGWVVCLACYGPVFVHWPGFEAVVLAEVGWPRMLAMTPLTFVAGAALMGLLVLYVSASVCFGMRFSNLSNRGVVTAGPYRLMKHPAYFAHVANAWLIAGVLMPAAGIDLGLSQWLVPLAFTLLYWARARTEEMHLGEDPDYVAYAEWIARHGLLARLRRLARL